MSAYLGVLGALFPVPAPDVSVDRPREVSYRTTLGGRRVAQTSLDRNRSWSVSLSAGYPEMLTYLAGLSAGEFGDGPFIWLTPWAQKTNLLTPAGSMLQIGHPPSGVSVGGAVTLSSEVIAGRHLIVEDSVTLPRVRGELKPVPVRQGKPVTGSVWINGWGDVWLVFLDADLNEVGSSARNHFEGRERVSVTSTVPSGAVSVVLRISSLEENNVVEVTRPAVTWTDGMMPYHLGSGASSVVFDGLSNSILVAAETPGLQLAGASFQVVEVGE